MQPVVRKLLVDLSQYVRGPNVPRVDHLACTEILDEELPGSSPLTTTKLLTVEIWAVPHDSGRKLFVLRLSRFSLIFGITWNHLPSIRRYNRPKLIELSM